MSGYLIGPSGVATASIAAWTPASATTAFWYDATNAASLSTTVNGASVSSWNDLSGNGRHLSQATGTMQPLYTTSALNSLPGVHFQNASSSTTDSNMQSTSFVLSQGGVGLTIVAVFKTGVGGPNNNSGGMSSFAVLLDDASMAGTRIIMFADANSVSDHAVATTGTNLDTGVVLSASTAYHFAAIFNGVSSSTDINGTTASGNVGGGGILSGITIGPNFATAGTTSNGIDLYLCEMFCITDSSNLPNALTYVFNKWGV